MCIRDRAGALRIGHGIAMRGNSEVQKMIREKGIGVEMCPISNLQTKAVESESQYPLREFLDNGIKVTINTDNRTVSNTTMTKELQFIQEHYSCLLYTSDMCDCNAEFLHLLGYVSKNIAMVI